MLCLQNPESRGAVQGTDVIFICIDVLRKKAIDWDFGWPLDTAESESFI